MPVSVGIDVGGTFTDLVLLDEESGQLSTIKLSSTPADQSQGLLGGLERSGLAMSEFGVIVHGTTVATNAILERKGARCALITTHGFRDVLEMRRRDRPQTWGLRGTFQPIIPREHRYEVDERTDATGHVLKELDPAQLESLVRQILADPDEIEAVAVCFIHSYANPHNEEIARRVLEKLWPNNNVVLSSEVMPELREFERTSTTSVNAYVQPIISRYLNHLEESLRERGYERDVLLIQSNGGLMSLGVAARFAVNTVLSGPAAGVIAASYTAQQAGFPNAITADMGGTSLDASVVVGGQPRLTGDTKIDFGVPVRTPMIEILTIGAGGGSIAWLDPAGFLQIGPQSAGAFPGPVCYAKGGQKPTVTDANVVLGRINPARSISGDRLDVEAAGQAIESQIGQPLGLGREAAAQAIIKVANLKMANSLRLISLERGHDPREFALVPFGGAGPLHAGALMHEVGIGATLVPYYPGITSAIGCLMADARHDFTRTLNQRLIDLDLGGVRTILDDYVAEGKALLAKEAIRVERIESLFEAEMGYEGQVHSIRATLPTDLDVATLQAQFEAAYRREYGRILENIPVRLVTLRTAVIGLRPRLDLRRFGPSGATSLQEALRETRPVYFEDRFYPTPIYDRSKLSPGLTLDGPAIVEQADSTTLIEPDMTARVDDFGNIIVSMR